MTKDEALKMALDFIEKSEGGTADLEAHIKEALAQPEQEPFGYFQYSIRLDAWVQNRINSKGVAFYTTPPQRKPLIPQSPCEMTQAEGRMFKLGWLECEAAHGIGEKK